MLGRRGRAGYIVPDEYGGTIPEFLSGLFSSDGFMPHGHCYLWQPEIVWLHVLSDAAIGLSYTSIPFTLAYFVKRRTDVPFNWIFRCFALFIILCGTTHFMEVYTLWTPAYRISGVLKAATACVSIATAVLLVQLVPKALAIPTAGELRLAHARLREANDALEDRVRERTIELTKKNEELIASEARFRRLSEAGIVGMFITKGDALTEANETFLALVGHSPEDLQGGKLLASTIEPGPQPELDERGVIGARETELVKSDGTRVTVLVGAASLDESSRMSFVVDLTERKRAEESVRLLRYEREQDAKFQALVESAPDAMVITNGEGVIVLLNARAEQMFDHPRLEILGRPIDVLLPERLRALYAERRNRRIAGTDPDELSLDLVGLRKNGEELPIEIVIAPLATKDGLLVSTSIRDSTARKQAENALRRAKEAAEHATRELESFSYSVAHDLRGPLRAIDGFSHAVLDDAGPLLDDASRGHLHRIIGAGSRMKDIIDALLSLAHVSKTELRVTAIDLAKIGRSIIDQHRLADTARSVELVTPTALTAHGDAGLVRIVLENLLGNAWKFTSKKAQARIELGVGADGTYFVRDDGAGFDDRFTQKLFKAFERLHDRADFDGHGIGLATVQRIISRHGGRVWAEGKPGAGATFHFTLSQLS